MSTVKICVEIPEAEFHAYEQEAAKRGITVENLVERMVRGLIEEMRTEQQEGTDHPIIPA
jgi:hypothetical protein